MDMSVSKLHLSKLQTGQKTTACHGKTGFISKIIYKYAPNHIIYIIKTDLLCFSGCVETTASFRRKVRSTWCSSTGVQSFLATVWSAKPNYKHWNNHERDFSIRSFWINEEAFSQSNWFGNFIIRQANYACQASRVILKLK